MKVRKILIACILMFGLAGFTTSYTSHATSTAIKYENEGNGTYVPVYNDGNGPAGGLGFGPAPLNKSQAEQYNASHDPDEKSKVTHNTNNQSYTSNSSQTIKQNNLESNNKPNQNDNNTKTNKKVHKYNHSKKTPTKSKDKTKSVKNTKHHNRRNYILYALIAMIIVACLGAIYGIIKKLTKNNK